MLVLNIQEKGMNETLQHLYKLPGVFARARRSALSSVGYSVKKDVEDYIASGGQGTWPALHPMTIQFKKTKGKKPLIWLKRFVRYVINKEGTAVEVKLDTRHGISNIFGSVDKRILPIFLRHEYGEKRTVTEAMRRFIAASSKSRAAEKYKRPQMGRHYFAIKKSTKQLEIPKREISGPVLRMIEGKVYRRFSDKFYQALDRYGV